MKDIIACIARTKQPSISDEILGCNIPVLVVNNVPYFRMITLFVSVCLPMNSFTK